MVGPCADFVCEVPHRACFDRSSSHPVSYAITLRVLRDGRWQTIHCFDNAHDFQEHHEHRYVGDRKEPPAITYGDTNAAMASATEKLLKTWPTLVEVWEKTR